MFYLIFTIFLILSSAFPVHAYGAHTASDIGAEVGRYAPVFELTDLSGNTVKMESLRGSVVLLNFWSTFCASCMAQMPSKNRLYAALKEEGLQIISVSVDPTEETVREYVIRNNIGFPVLLDKDRRVFFKQYSDPGLPATYLIDKNGLIVEKFNGLGVWDASEMKNRILLLLGKKG